MTAEPITAMSCPGPDPWFLESIALRTASPLPEGVLLRVAPRRANPTENEPPWNKAVLNWLEIENTTSIPLFLLDDAAEFQAQMGYPAISWPDEDLGDAPSTLKTRVKSQNSTFYGWPYNCAVVRCDRVEWQAASGQVMIADGLWGTSSGFQDRITRKKDRPANVTVPPPQEGVLTLSYDRRTITVPFVVTYELNHTYDPNAGTENCGSGLLVLGGIVLLLISAGTALPILVLLRLLRGRLRRPATSAGAG